MSARGHRRSCERPFHYRGLSPLARSGAVTAGQWVHLGTVPMREVGSRTVPGESWGRGRPRPLGLVVQGSGRGRPRSRAGQCHDAPQANRAGVDGDPHPKSGCGEKAVPTNHLREGSLMWSRRDWESGVKQTVVVSFRSQSRPSSNRTCGFAASGFPRAVGRIASHARLWLCPPDGPFGLPLEVQPYCFILETVFRSRIV